MPPAVRIGHSGSLRRKEAYRHRAARISRGAREAKEHPANLEEDRKLAIVKVPTRAEIHHEEQRYHRVASFEVKEDEVGGNLCGPGVHVTVHLRRKRMMTMILS